MVRTQIQLTESQAAALKKMAAVQHTSMANVIRQAIDYFAKTGEMTTSDEYRRRAGKEYPQLMTADPSKTAKLGS